MKYDIVIVGAGLYGSTIAALAKAEGKKPLVLEKNMASIYMDET